MRNASGMCPPDQGDSRCTATYVSPTPPVQSQITAAENNSTFGKVLDKLKITGCCKTSGASGMHVYIPLHHKYDYDLVRDFAKMLATMVHELIPETTTLERSISKRKKNEVYIDYLQNSRGQTLASAYSVRPKPGATVSAPLEWQEVKRGLHPSRFTIKNMKKRADKKGDLFGQALEKGFDIPAAMRQIQKLEPQLVE